MKRGHLRFISLLLIISAFTGCSLSEQPGITILSDYYDFNLQGPDGWTVDFTNYPTTAEDSANYELEFAYTNLPGNLSNKMGIKISGNNQGNDLFMFMKKKVSGLPPSTLFSVIMQVELASNSPTGTIVTGGAPGEAVYLKAGATTLEPKKINAGGYYELNVDKGDQSVEGSDLINLGHIGVEQNTTDYQLIVRSNENQYQPFYVESNNQGELWLIVGTDSGYQGTTTLYYTRLNFIFTYLK